MDEEKLISSTGYYDTETGFEHLSDEELKYHIECSKCGMIFVEALIRLLDDKIKREKETKDE